MPSIFRTLSFNCEITAPRGCARKYFYFDVVSVELLSVELRLEGRLWFWFGGVECLRVRSGVKFSSCAGSSSLTQMHL